jgi:hypothetical protein
MFTINPNKETAILSRQAQSSKVKKSINYLIQECINKLKLSDIAAASPLSSLEKIDKLSPEIHYLHHMLQSAMRKQDPLAAKLELYKLINEIINCPTQESWIKVSSITNSAWETFISNEAIRLTKEDCGEIAVIEPISESELIEAKDLLNAAINLIARHDPLMFDEIHEQVSIIKLFNGKVTMGLTDVRMLGAMFIRLPRMQVNSVLYFFEHIIHEASHIHLNCLMAIDPLILNLPDEKFISPLRHDLRPMIGVFHATFVSTRIVRSLVNLYKSTNNIDLLHPLAESMDEVIRGIAEIKQNAKLTENGEKIVNDMQDIVDTTSHLPQWQSYDFIKSRTHRFGAGASKVDSFSRYYYENHI